MKKEIVTLACALTLLGSATSAMAGAYGEPVQPEEGPTPVAVAPEAAAEEPIGYWYLGAGALFSIENFECQADDAWGYNLRAGRRINDLFAVEAMWEHPVSKFDDTSRVDGYGNPGSDVNVYNATVNAKVYPVQGQFQPYALAGIGWGQADLSHDHNSDFISRFAVGLDVLLTDNIGLVAEVGYVLGTGDLSNFDQIPVSFGAFYNFR